MSSPGSPTSSFPAPARPRNGEDPAEIGAESRSGLRHYEDEEQCVFVWKTPESLAGTCADFVLHLDDDTEHRAPFAFT